MKEKIITNLEEFALQRANLSGRLILTNGCFDLIHVGHVRYLYQAKALGQPGDILLVGVNSDYSVKQLKGASRPVKGQDERTEILAAFEMIDYVCIFNEMTADNLIKTVSPDIYVKGGDYTMENLPEADSLKAVNAEFIPLNYYAGHSTTDLIAKAN